MENMDAKKSGGYEIRMLTLRDILGPLFRNWGVVLAIFGLIFVTATFVAWGWANHYYVANMQVVVARERSNPTVTGQQNGVADNETAVTADEVASEIALLQGRDMLQEVAQICNLTKQKSSFLDSLSKPDSRDLETKNAAELEGATKALAAKLRVDPLRTSHVIDVRYGRSGSPETPACVLQTLGKLYLEKHVRLQRPAGAFDFFAQETETYRQALAESEQRLADFSKREGIAAPEVLRTDMAQQLVAAEASLYQSRQAMAADVQRIANIRAQMAVTPARSSTAEASNSADILLEQLESTLLTTQLKRTQLLLKFDPSYPLVKEVDEEIAQTNEAIAKAEDAKYINRTTDRDSTFEYLRQDRAKTEADLASERATAETLGNTIRGMQHEIVNLDVQAVKQGALAREAKANEANYLLYLSKREQERTSDALDQKQIANVAIAVPAVVPVLPAYSPSTIMFLGLICAVFGGIVAGYLAELLDPTFRTPVEVEDLLKIAVLAAVPKRAA
jgi:uncharacterized protein involved in exopolysaccharide biosynthesis